VYLGDCKLAAEATHLTAANKLSQSTRYLEKQEKEDWESLPEIHTMPPDWDTFKEALFRDYPDAWKAYVSSEVLDEFIEEKSRQTIKSLTQFATFNREFRRIMARLVTEGRSNPEELKKAYTKSINSDLRRKIQIYLKSKKAPILKGEPYSIEQVREAAEYILEGLDPHLEDIIMVHQLESLKRGPSPMPVPVKSEMTELLNAINMLGQNFQAALMSI